MAKQSTQNKVSFYLKILFATTATLALCITACSKDEGVNNAPLNMGEGSGAHSNSDVVTPDNNTGSPDANGNDATVNIDSLTNAIKNDIYNSVKDSLGSKNNTDKKENDNIDSLTKSDKDSLTTPTDSTSSNQSVTSSLNARVESLEVLGSENIYGAFANHYPLMYEDFTFQNKNGDSITLQSPFPVVITNTCNTTIQCGQKKVMVKTWIPGFTDTTTITGIIPPADSIILSPNLNFNDDALLSIASAKKVNRQIRVYALENDNQILFHSESKPTTIHPMQVFGSLEPALLNDPIHAPYWYSLWVTPMADSISRIINEVAQKMPNGQIKVYQKYDMDETIEQSSARIVAAVFEVLQSRNIKYVENDGAGSYGQRINYPIETLRKKQGICIETAVLFASVLERIKFETFLIIIPNHAFVGWIADQDNSTIDYIETTMIGDKNASALSAILKGIEEHNEQVKLGNIDSRKTLIVPISITRAVNITPNNIP